MLPKGPLGRQMLTKLKVYAGPDHPHAANPSRSTWPRPRPLTRRHPAGYHCVPGHAGLHASGHAVDARLGALALDSTWLAHSHRRCSVPRSPRPPAAARRRSPGPGCAPAPASFTVNGRPFESYFTTPAHRMEAIEPLACVEATERFDVDATITGGGVSGQAGALRMALARSLAEAEPENRTTLKKAGLLTRDPRKKESKKYGLKKARKAPQFTKR